MCVCVCVWVIDRCFVIRCVQQYNGQIGRYTKQWTQDEISFLDAPCQRFFAAATYPKLRGEMAEHGWLHSLSVPFDLGKVTSSSTGDVTNPCLSFQVWIVFFVLPPYRAR
jgi:hypothetical protein